jgi:hypothetical protein
MTTINEVKEVEIDEEDELDGWGPVRVRPSTIPARNNEAHAPLEAAPSPAQEAKQLEILHAFEAEHITRRLLT